MSTADRPLLCAVQKGDVQSVQRLLSNGASPDVGNFYMTPLFRAILDDNYEIFQTLLLYDANVNLELCGGTAMKYAFKYGRLEMLRRLHSLNAELKPEDFETALNERQYKCAEFFLESCSATMKSNLVKNVMYMQRVLLSNDVDLVRLLKKHGWNYFDDGEERVKILSQLVKNDCSKVIRQLGDEGVDFNVQDQFGMAPLLWCSDYSVGSDTLKELLDHGANVNHTCQLGGDSALYLCSQKGNLQKVKLLIRYGADPNLRNKYGESPLDVASASGYGSVVKHLLESGAVTNTELKNYHSSIADVISVHLHTVKTLQHLTRLVIRARFVENGYCLTEMKTLPLPKALINYLSFQEISI